VLLENFGEDRLYRSREKRRSITKSQGGKEHTGYNKKERKANWIGHILRRNRLLKQVIEVKIKENTEETER
jgi:hypothetical protein